MPLFLTLALIFTLTFSVIAGALYLWRQRPAEGAWNVAASPESILLREESVSSIGFWAELLERFALSDLVGRQVAEAGLNWSVGRCTALMLMSGASTAVVLSRISWLPVFAIVLGATFALSAPWFYIRHLRQKRFQRFDQHFPDALDSLGRAMRAGHAFSAALDLVATESAAPVSTELRKTLEEWRLGQSWDEALEHLAERVPLPSVRLFVASVRVQSKAGGKLHEILARISESLREAASLEGEIRSISAHGRLTGLILMVIPIGIAVTLHFTSPGHLDILSTHPVGQLMIAAAIAALVAAHFVIQRILDIEV